MAAAMAQLEALRALDRLVRRRGPRVVHVVCVLSAHGNRVNPVGSPFAPRSAVDALMVHATRAASHLTVTSGRNLRDEPGLCMEVAPLAPLATWRRRWAHDKCREVALLTGGRALPLDARFFGDLAAAGRALRVYTPKAQCAPLRSALGAAHAWRVGQLRVLPVPAGGLRQILAGETGLVGVEVGPTTALCPWQGLYAGALPCQRSLLVTEFEGDVDPRLPTVGEPLDLDALGRGMTVDLDAAWDDGGRWRVRLFNEEGGRS